MLLVIAGGLDRGLIRDLGIACRAWNPPLAGMVFILFNALLALPEPAA